MLLPYWEHDGNIDTDDAPIKRHNFNNDLDYQNYINRYALGNIKIVLDFTSNQGCNFIAYSEYKLINVDKLLLTITNSTMS